MNINTQLIRLIVVLTFLSSTIIGAANMYLSIDSAKSKALETNQISATLLANEVELFMTDAKGLVEAMAVSPTVCSLDLDKIQEMIRATQQKNPQYELMFVQDTTGQQIVKTSGILKNNAYREYFKEAMKGGTFISDVYISTFTNATSITISTPIKNPAGQIIGVFGADISLKAISDISERTKIGQTGYVDIVDQKGTLIANPNMERVLIMENVADKPYVKDIMSGKFGSGESVSTTGIPSLVAYAPMKMLGWGVVTYEPSAEITAIIIKNLLITLAMILVAVIIAGIAAVYAARRITRPVNRLVEVTQKIANGNMSEHVQVDSQDEIAKLAASFNKMMDKLRNMMCELESKNQLLQIEIRKQEQSQIALAASEEKFKKAFRQVADIIGIVRLRDGKYIEVNDVFFSKLGYSRAEIFNRTSKELGIWCDSTEYEYSYAVMRQSGQLHNQKTRWRAKNGDILIGVFSADVTEISGEQCIIFVLHDITEITNAQEELILLNQQLEHKVDERTQELFAVNEELLAANDEIVQNMENLKEMQEQLVQSEKMASLGNLVAGVAHEINTPVGVGVTAASHLQLLVKEFKQLAVQQIQQQDLDDFIADCSEGTEIISLNLARASSLIKSFKQISIDQSNEIRRKFNVRQYIDYLLLSLRPMLKKEKHVLEVICDVDMEIDGYPGAFAQILTNLIVNSLTHAYGPENAGHIKIAVIKDADKVIHLTYSDDGRGIHEDILPKVFDPFFTTRRSVGSGLGLTFVYNIVTHKFGGKVKCLSKPGQGATFILSWNESHAL